MIYQVVNILIALRFKALMLQSNLCDNSDVSNVLKEK